MRDEAWVDTVRLARDFGTVSELFPRWCTDLRDLPYPLFEAITSACVVLSWDELLEHERPPERMWDSGDQLKEWFEQVKRNREAEAKGEKRAIEDPVENDAAKGLLVG